MSASDNSDEENGNFKAGHNAGDAGQVCPTWGKELNHAVCIKDLSFYKLDWSDSELHHFHRPNILHSIGNQLKI